MSSDERFWVLNAPVSAALRQAKHFSVATIQAQVAALWREYRLRRAKLMV
jgi:hypothetical protein